MGIYWTMIRMHTLILPLQRFCDEKLLLTLQCTDADDIHYLDLKNMEEGVEVVCRY